MRTVPGCPAVYLLDLNATGAARRAGHSVATAHVQGTRLLVNVRVKQRFAELLGKRLGMFRDRLEVSPADGQDDTVLIERLAKGDPAAAVLTRLIGRPSFSP